MEKQEQKKQWQEFRKDILGSMDVSYNELRRILDPVFHNKTQYVNGKLMKNCFRHIGDIIHGHHILIQDASSIKSTSLGGKDAD